MLKATLNAIWARVNVKRHNYTVNKHTPLKMQITLKVLKARYHQKLAIPQVVS
jgi:hypothetical protein